MEAARNLEVAGDHGPILSPSPYTQFETQNAFARVLGYDLATNRILSLLNLADMKALSAVSKVCCGAVRNNEEFKKRATLNICQESLAAQLGQKSSYQWRHISIHLPIPGLAPELITDLVKSAKSISVWLSGEPFSYSLQMQRFLMEILSRTTNLQGLEMHTYVFTFDLMALFSNPRVKTLLANLEVLAIQSRFRYENCFLDVYQNRDDLQFKRNFRQLAEVAFHLKKFVLGKFELFGRRKSDCRHVKYIPKIIKASKDTLETLELHGDVWKLDEMKEIRCPNLKRLVLSAHGPKIMTRASQKDSEVVEAFLRNQPPLEELVIKIKNHLPLTILMTLQERVSKMKKLHIKTKNIPSSELMKWNFLDTMHELRDFRIKRLSRGFFSNPVYLRSGEEILDKLHSTVEQISLQGFYPFWYGPFLPTSNIGEVLGRFKNLTVIDFLRSGDAVTDLGLQCVISHCKKLISLVISHCLRLTDFGISGVKKSEDGTSEEKVGVSLKELRGLIHFRIFNCRKVFSECVLKEVEFDFLRFFHYDGELIEPKAFLAKLARLNPCLEEAALCVTNDKGHDDEYLREMTKEMKETYPRVRIIDIPSNPEWNDYDSESDSSFLPDDGNSDDVGSDMDLDDNSVYE